LGSQFDTPKRQLSGQAVLLAVLKPSGIRGKKEVERRGGMRYNNAGSGSLFNAGL